MRILICPDKFKESLSSSEVAKYLEQGIMKSIPSADCYCLPMADGGEGTVEALVNATKGRYESCVVQNPLMQPVEVRFGISGDEETAIMEMAAASGMALLKPGERNPMVTTSYGTGLMIRQALNQNLKKIIIGIGGSATVDAGVGMAQALGMRFFDEMDVELPLGAGGGMLSRIKRIDNTLFDFRIKDTEILVASDVDNLLCGPYGAARVFGPQKGADEDMVELLDKNLSHVAQIIERDLHVDVKNLKGGGAAGGMGAGLVAFLGAELKNGFELVSGFVKLEKRVDWADLIITGEGKTDIQTSFGKTPAGIARMAQSYKKPVIAVTGMLGTGTEKLYEIGFSAIISICDKPMSIEHAIFNASQLLEDTGERIGRILKVGKSLEW